jgi:hypothetical protein
VNIPQSGREESGNMKSTPRGKFKAQSNNTHIMEMCHDAVFQKLKELRVQEAPVLISTSYKAYCTP